MAALVRREFIAHPWKQVDQRNTPSSTYLSRLSSAAKHEDAAAVCQAGAVAGLTDGWDYSLELPDLRALLLDTPVAQLKQLAAVRLSRVLRRTSDIRKTCCKHVEPSTRFSADQRPRRQPRPNVSESCSQACSSTGASWPGPCISAL